MQRDEPSIEVLIEAPRVLGDTLATRPAEPEVIEERPYNKNISELVRLYIDEIPEETPATVLAVKDIVRHLRSKGIKGKERSLYSYTYAILKGEMKKGALRFQKGVGYFKPNKFDTIELKL
jgi:hypothetical protein